MPRTSDTVNAAETAFTVHTGGDAETAFTVCDLPLPDRRTGKVRVSYRLDEGRRLFVTTDRLSAFDVILGGARFKGQVLNQLAAWWFRRTTDIVANHFESEPDPNATIAREGSPLPVEVIVRGHITGVTSTALWQQYANGARTIYGYTFPDGMRKNQQLTQPIVTPTSKAETGTGHDEPLTCAEVTERGLVRPDVWRDAHDAALALFARGCEVAAGAGLILADTKYEFALDADGELMLIDEMHTPDSSRYWVAETYHERVGRGEEPESLDKEPVRQALQRQGYGGDGAPPPLGPQVWAETSARYIRAYETLTGTTFVPGEYPVVPRLLAHLREGHIL